MDSGYFFLGAGTAVLVFGAYFTGLLRGQRDAVQWRKCCTGLRGSLSRKGFAWSVLLPTFWIFLYYAFVAHVRISMGRWPHFGENLPGRSLAFHHKAVVVLMGALVASLSVVPVIALAGAMFPRRRHVCVYSVCYAAGVGVAWGALFLAPHPFLNWLFD